MAEHSFPRIPVPSDSGPRTKASEDQEKDGERANEENGAGGTVIAARAAKLAQIGKSRSARSVLERKHAGGRTHQEGK